MGALAGHGSVISQEAAGVETGVAVVSRHEALRCFCSSEGIVEPDASSLRPAYRD
jgi:hypothetical protein